jgi:hypothetical protein
MHRCAMDFARRRGGHDRGAELDRRGPRRGAGLDAESKALLWEGWLERSGALPMESRRREQASVPSAPPRLRVKLRRHVASMHLAALRGASRQTAAPWPARGRLRAPGIWARRRGGKGRGATRASMPTPKSFLLESWMARCGASVHGSRLGELFSPPSALLRALRVNQLIWRRLDAARAVRACAASVPSGRARPLPLVASASLP